MDKQFLKDFHRWLDTANVGELFAKRDILHGLVRSGECDRETESYGRRCIRMINLELDARAEAANFSETFKRRWKKAA